MFNTVQNTSNLRDFYLLEYLIFNSAIKGKILQNEIEKAIQLGDTIWKNLNLTRTKPSNIKEKIRYYFEVGCDYEYREDYLMYWKYIREEIKKKNTFIDDRLIQHFNENVLRLRIENLEGEEDKKFYLGADFDGKVYPLWRVARTGRYYTSNPNLQGLSLEKLAYYFDLSGLDYFDFPQFEITLVAFFSQDEELINLIENEIDVYEYVRDRFKLADRREAKKRLLGSIYGRDETYLPFKKVKEWKNFLLEKVKENPFVKIGDIQLFVDRDYKVWNYFIQSFGAYFVRKFLEKLIESGYKIYLYRHDGFLYQGKKLQIKSCELLYLLYLFFKKN
ncbi:MAG: DNA polymerase [Thermofilaceae archaeon]